MLMINSCIIIARTCHALASVSTWWRDCKIDCEMLEGLILFEVQVTVLLEKLVQK